MQPAELEGAVQRQSWEWLFDLPRRLDVAIELTDADSKPLLPAGQAPAAAALRRMLTTREPSLASAISGAARSTTPARVALDGLEVLCFGLWPAGVLVVARDEAGEDSTDSTWEDLESIGSWLARAIEPSLTNPPNAVSVEPYRMASLQRILREATSRGEIRKVIGAFVESLGVWDDVRVRSYVAGANGGFFQYVSPVAAPPSSVPAELDDAAVPRNNRIARLSRADADRLGLAGEPGDVLLLRLRAGADGAWLFVFSGRIDGREQVRLTLYSDILRQSLDDVLAAAKARVAAAVPRPAPPLSEPVESAVEKALAQLTAAIGGREAALVVTAPTGREALVAGNADLLPPLDREARRDRLVVTSSDGGSVMAVVMAREQPPFASFEREIVQAGASILHQWLQAHLESSTDSERRHRFRPVDTVFDRLAADSVDAGRPASVIVLSVDVAALRPGLMQTWLGSIRGALRAGDFAGAVSGSEIAVLLCDASADQAAVVSSRLKQLLESDDRAGRSLHPALWTTTRSPESAFDGSLVAAARAGAAAVR